MDDTPDQRPLTPKLSRRELIANERIGRLEDRRKRLVALAGLVALILILGACVAVFLHNGGDPYGHYVYVPRPRRT